MTKSELLAQHPKLNEKLATPAFRAVLECAREDCEFLNMKATDPTSIVRNEGAIQGWMACLKFLKDIHKAPAEKKAPLETPRYSDPDPLKANQPPKS